MPETETNNKYNGVKGWLLFLCIILVFLLPIIKAGTTLYTLAMGHNISKMAIELEEVVEYYGEETDPQGFDTEEEWKSIMTLKPMVPDLKKCMNGFSSWLVLLFGSKSICTLMGFCCGILLWMKKPFGAKLLKIYPIAILLGVFVCFISLIYWKSNHPVLFSLQELSETLGGPAGGGTLIESVLTSPNLLVVGVLFVVVAPSVLWASVVFIYSRRSKRMHATYPEAYKTNGQNDVAHEAKQIDDASIESSLKTKTTASSVKADNHSTPVAISSFRPIAIFGGGILAFILFSILFIFVAGKAGANKRVLLNERVKNNQMALNEQIEKIEKFRGRKFAPEMVKTALEIFATKVSDERKAEFFEEINNRNTVWRITESFNQALARGEMEIEEISANALTDHLLRNNDRTPFISEFLMAKAKANRIKCVNNLGSIGKGLTGFAIDNDDRLPWQLTPAQQAIHKFEGSNIGINSAGSIANIGSMRNELQTPKILQSPCDPARAEGNELLQSNWRKATAEQVNKGMSYGFCVGGDAQRPSTVLALTANIRTSDLATGDWTGIDETPVPFQAFGGLNIGQGQLVNADGSAKQSTNADIGRNGGITKAHINSRGGHSRGNSKTGLILPRWN